MKILYLLLALACASPLYSQLSFKAITYNIKWNDIMVDIDKWDDRKEAMLVFFQDEDADFLGLQEVLEDQLYFISKGLEMYKTMGVGRDDGKIEGEFSPILYNTKRWKSLESRTIWLSETPEKVSRGWDAACNRLVTFGMFRNLESGDSLAVFNTHFDHKGIVARRNSVELLVDFVRERSQGLPCIILGDFNLNPKDLLYSTLSDDFNDSYKDAYHISTDHEGTFNGFRRHGEYQQRIDYIFYRGGLEVISYDCPDIRIQGRHVSDHFPVIVVMDLLSDD